MSGTAGEKLQSDSAMPLQQHLNDVNGAIATLTGPGGDAEGASASGGPDAMTNEFIASAISPVAGIAAAIADGIGPNNNSGSSSQKKHGISQFVRQHAPTPLVPLTWAQKKAIKAPIAKAGNIWASVRLAGMSLTGRGTGDSDRGKSADKDKKGPKGLKIKEAAVKKLTELTKEVAVTMQAMTGTNPFNSTKRLVNELGNDSSSAKQAVQVNHKLMPAAPGGVAAA